MGSSTAATERSSKKHRPQVWKKALLHSSLCFVMGFFSGFAPSSVSDWTSAAATTPQPHATAASALPRIAAEPYPVNRSLLAQFSPSLDHVGGGGGGGELRPRPLLVVVTTTARSDKASRPAELTRMAHTMRLVPPPLLWVVVEPTADVPATARLLRSTGVMYRHLTYKENFTDAEAAAEAHHQRNVALGHVEHHRLAGVVHFAGLGNVYDLQFFEQLRGISVFGAWPVATVSANGNRVVVEGPTCSSSRILGWFWKDLSNESTMASRMDGAMNNGAVSSKPPQINIYGFGFNSSVLWDPERWGRHPTSEPDTSQDSAKFVQEVVLEDETKLKGIPSDCSQIMVWHVHTPTSSTTQNLEKVEE